MAPQFRQHRIPACLLILLIGLSFLPCQARHASAAGFTATGEEKLSLNGLWQFSITPDKDGPGNPPRDAKAWTDTMPVPGNWDLTNKFAHHIGKAWHRRTFQLPADWQGSRVALRFEAVYETSLVWLNGALLGRHTNGYLPFEFDITDKLKPAGQENELIVMADSTHRRGAWWAWGGISRDVNLIRHNDVRIIAQRITAEPDLKTGKASLSIRYTIENAGAKPQSVTLTPAMMIPGAAAPAGLPATRILVNPGARAGAAIQADLKPDQVKLWHFDHPNLYRIQTVASVEGQPVHARTDRIGIRKVEVRDNKFFLNGEPMRLGGFNRVSDDRIAGSTEPDALVRKDVDMMKSMGSAMARLMHYPQAPNLLDYLDEKGMMIIEEIPVWGYWDPNVFKDNPATKQWLAEMIQRDFNHPCIIGWSAGNELEHHYDYVTSMIDLIRKLDPSRLANTISFTVARKDATPANDPATFSDIIFWNTYGGAKDGASSVNKKWPAKTQFLSEFGAGQLGIELDKQFEPRLLTMFEEIRRDCPYVAGVSLWTFNDYRSSYPGSNPYEERSWGVVNSWRQERRAAAQIREQFSPVRKLELMIDGAKPVPGATVPATIRITPRAVADLPSFTLNAYLMKWEVRLADGKVAGGGLLPLPTLKPGAPVWESPVTLKIPASGAGEIAVSLISPTGYVVAQSRLPLAVPPAPAIRQIITADGGVRILLDKPRGAAEVKVRYGKDGKLESETPATIGDAAWVSGLDPKAQYQFAAVAVNAAGESQPSAMVAAQPRGLPLPPRILDVTALDGGFNVGYSSAEGDTSTTLELGTTSGVYSQTLAGLQVKGSCRVEGLKNGQPCFFRMKRQMKDGESGWSEERQVTPQAPAAPPTPKMLGVVRGKGLASLGFDPVAGATGYVVRYQATGAGQGNGQEKEKEITREIRAAFVEQVLIDGLDGSKPYRFALAAKNAQGTSPFSEPIEAAAE